MEIDEVCPRRYTGLFLPWREFSASGVSIAGSLIAAEGWKLYVSFLVEVDDGIDPLPKLVVQAGQVFSVVVRLGQQDDHVATFQPAAQIAVSGLPDRCVIL